MTDAITLDLDRVTGLDSLAYFSEFGHLFAPGDPYRDLEQVVAALGADGAVIGSHDRTILGWLLARQAGNPLASLTAFAAVTSGISDISDEAPEGADLDAPGDG